ncbi:hypothetical protein [Metabacillus arenae]|uniref:Uncharacterized protein n=1 Tax=Metabacillus arenae TaxID=2771434 RepID=A0A926N8E2_9BACI|nr:hypothetical protein [Metabacillus arenae]MBD1379342.1 hypothetical protein [Metabacillus arenae]
MIFDAFQAGPFTIQFYWIVVIITSFLTYIIMSVLLERKVDMLLFFKQNYLNANVLLLGFYKFGNVLLNFHQVIYDPLVYLYLSGNSKTFIIGILSVTCYLFYKGYKQRKPIKQAVMLLLMTYTIAFAVYKGIEALFATLYRGIL